MIEVTSEQCEAKAHRQIIAVLWNDLDELVRRKICQTVDDKQAKSAIIENAHREAASDHQQPEH